MTKVLIFPGVALIALSAGGRTSAEEHPPNITHPNLLLNRQEIEKVKAKIEQHEWAARLFKRVRELAEDPRRTDRIPREAALVHVLTGEERYAQAVRKALLNQARYWLPRYENLDLKRDPDFGGIDGPS